MIESSGLTGRYAKALYELATEKKLVSKIVKDFHDIKKLLENNYMFLNMIKNPSISKVDKQSSVIAVLTKMKVDKLTIKFCGTLAVNGRLIYLKQIQDVFLSLVSKRNGEVQAEVTSAFKLDKDQQKQVETAVSEATGVKKISLSLIVDETLIAGLIVKIGSKMIDSSIKTKLNRLELAMRGTN
ncbi:ATP synthase F1 subunit delta [Alphaproteobacteria bacterium]|nr:ATP synthase F1 subunit delta [Alphaproteobacteria bacterium]